MNYAELHCLSNFTFLRGASRPEELVARAHELGYAALALTDECSLAGVVRAHVAAKAGGLKLIVGSEFRVEEGLRVVLLATDRTGYGHLSALITRGRRNALKGSYRLVLADILDGLPGCLALLLPQPMPTLAQAKRVAAVADAELKRRKIVGAVIAVVQPDGSLVYFEKMDKSTYVSNEFALAKARTAAITLHATGGSCPGTSSPAPPGTKPATNKKIVRGPP